jgi:hypothetical protein
MSRQVVGIASFESLLADVEKANRRQQIDGFTVHQVSVAIGKSRPAALKLVNDAFYKGLVECAGKTPVTAIDGRLQMVPVYRRVKRKK